MIARLERTDPRSCLNKALDDEWLFVLLGRDAAAPAVIEAWVAERVRLGLNAPGDRQLTEAQACAARMRHYRDAVVAELGKDV